MNNLRLIGTANQDQELADIGSRWTATPPDMQDEFLSWLEDEDLENAKRVFSERPSDWVHFVQQCAAAGLRQVVIDSDGLNE